VTDVTTPLRRRALTAGDLLSQAPSLLYQLCCRARADLSSVDSSSPISGAFAQAPSCLSAVRRILRSESRLGRFDQRCERGLSVGAAVCVASLTLVFAFASVWECRAQGQISGSIRGTIKDAQGGLLSGVTIVAKSEQSPFTFRTISDAAGFFQLTDLPPGAYVLEAFLSGFVTLRQENVSVRAGLNIGLDLTLEVGPVADTVTVRADTPMLETGTAGSAINVDGALQRQLPLTSRGGWADSIMLGPGITSLEGTDRTLLFSLHGADWASNVLQIDGADVAAVTQSTVETTSLPTDAVEDAQVRTAGVDASVPLGLGAVVNVATKSGTNSNSGTLTSLGQPRAWNANNQPGGTAQTQRLFQVDMVAGGPIQRDKAWFFVAYRHLDGRTGISRSADQFAALLRLDSGFTPFDSDQTVDSIFIKPSAQIGEGQRLVTSYQYDRQENSTAGATSLTPDTLGSRGSVALARLESAWTDRLVTRATVSFNDKTFINTASKADEPSRLIYANTLLSAGRVMGVGLLGAAGASRTSSIDRPDRKFTVAVDATYALRGLVGAHDAQFGFYTQPQTRDKDIVRYVNDGAILEESVLRADGQRVPFHRQAVSATNLVTSYATTSDLALYVQDHWRPVTRLGITAGLRVDWIRRTDEIFDRVSQRSTEIGPRFGLNAMLTADGSTVARASWGRLHESLSQTAGDLGATRVQTTDTYDTNLDGSFDSTLVTPASTALSQNRIFDLAHRHQPYVNEATLGLDRQWKGQWATTVQWSRREYRDRTALVETNGIYDGSRFLGYLDVSQNEIYSVTSNRWNWPVVQTAELVVTKRAARVTILGSYARQWRHLAGTWQPRDPASFIQPDAFENSRGIGSTRAAASNTAEANSLSGTSMAQAFASSPWFDHTGRIAASWSAPLRLQVSATYIVQSGAWSGPVYTRVPTLDPQFGPPTITLANGNVVSNPLATLLRFVGPTRTDGQLQLDTYSLLNLRVGRLWRLQRFRLDTSVAVLNTLNADTDVLFRGANQDFSSTFGTTQRKQPPRTAQVRLSLSF
jgi:hypothetical protein